MSEDIKKFKKLEEENEILKKEIMILYKKSLLASQYENDHVKACITILVNNKEFLEKLIDKPLELDSMKNLATTLLKASENVNKNDVYEQNDHILYLLFSVYCN